MFKEISRIRIRKKFNKKIQLKITLKLIWIKPIYKNTMMFNFLQLMKLEDDENAVCCFDTKLDMTLMVQMQAIKNTLRSKDIG